MSESHHPSILLPDFKDAPKVFDGRSPDLLPRFIDAVEQLFKTCSVTDKKQQKEYLVKYAILTVEDEWQGLEMFADEFSFEDFKDKILNSYLETRDWFLSTLELKLLGSIKQIKDALDAQKLHLDQLESRAQNAPNNVPATQAKTTRYKRQMIKYKIEDVLDEGSSRAHLA